MNLKLACITTFCSLLTACQLISPIFVEYNGVRMDVAQWINHQAQLSMQQKRSLAQLSRAQQKLVQIDQITEEQKFEISKENAIAMHCAQQHLNAKKIEQLQLQIFPKNEKERILNVFENKFPKIKLDTESIKCD